MSCLSLNFLVTVVLFHSVLSIYTVNSENEVEKTFRYSEALKHPKKYKPNWSSLDSRPLPEWYDKAKLGIFVHWGVFSVPSFGSEWFWHHWKTESGSTRYRDFMKQRYPPNFTYQDFAKDFTAEFYNATKWSQIFEASGAKYVVLTSKHHEGYTLWPSKYSFSWNAGDVGPNRDLVGELAQAVRDNTKMKFGLYHSLFEWYNPLWLADQKNNFTSNDFVKFKVMPELYELIKLYKPEVVWSDGEWDAPDTYWKSKEFLAWLYNDSPVKETVVVNDRWGHETMCHHGDIYTCGDRYNPGVLQTHKWENAMTIDKKSWGFRRNAYLSDYMTTQELIKELVVTVSCGGNLLVNVGPTKDGLISPIYEERLRDMGDWLEVNGPAIYETIPWTTQNDTLDGNVWYTQNKDASIVFASVLKWPDDNVLRLKSVVPNENSVFYLRCRNFSRKLDWEIKSGITLINLLVEEHRGQPAWVVEHHRSV